MSASASRDEVARPSRADRDALGAGRGICLVCVEATLASVAFAALCVVILSVAPQIAEPDDGAYHHSILAITMGDFLTLSSAQLNALDAKMGGPVGQVPNQWVELANGRYLSEKDPGYPFLAAPFAWGAGTGRGGPGRRCRDCRPHGVCFMLVVLRLGG